MGIFFHPVKLTPIKSAEEWKQLLIKKEQFKDGYSAKMLYDKWMKDAKGSPDIVDTILKSKFPDIEFLFGFPEYKVNMPGKGFPSRNDIFILSIAN